MRRIKKAVKKTKVQIIKKDSGELILDETLIGSYSLTEVAINYFKGNGYDSNIEIEATEITDEYTMSVEDFIKYGELIEKTKNL